MKYSSKQLSDVFSNQNYGNNNPLEFIYIHGDPLLPIWFDETACIGLIDTGSNISLIHTDIFNKLDNKNYTLLSMPATDTAVVANGDEITFSHFIRLNFRLGNEKMSVEAYVCPSISFEMILGAHFFAENDLSNKSIGKSINHPFIFNSADHLTPSYEVHHIHRHS
jgi:hypothetical protein